MSKTLVDVLKLAAAIGVSHLAGVIGGIATASSVRSWYPTLHKPPFNPPAWVFGPVWLTLYTLMGAAAWLVWRAGLRNSVVRTALVLFLIQLVLNAAWSVIFFGLRSPFWAFVELIALWAAVAAAIVWFWRISAAAGIMLIPYILWASFAAVLNYYIWRLNP